MQKKGVFWKIQDICYQIGTEIFKIEEEMTEKMKHKVANPPLKMGRIHCSQYAAFDVPLHFQDLQWKQNLFHMLVEGKIKVVLYPWLGVSSSRTLMP